MYASALTTQSGSTWGLGRVSHRSPGASSYIYDDTAGSGSRVYVVDTGIYIEHNVSVLKRVPNHEINISLDRNSAVVHLGEQTSSPDQL
jgi:hypothetical protein